MTTPRGRYIAVVIGGPVDRQGDYVEFQALTDDVEERLNEAISREWEVLDEGTTLLVLRYTQQLQLQVGGVEAIAWAHEFKPLPRPGGEK